MPANPRVVEEFEGFEIVEYPIADQGQRRFFARKDGALVTKGYTSVEAVRTELQMSRIAQERARTLDPWMPSAGLAAAAPGSIFLYPLGRALLKALTLGRYPKARHNQIAVALFPGVVLLLVFVLLTLIYS